MGLVSFNGRKGDDRFSVELPLKTPRSGRPKGSGCGALSWISMVTTLSVALETISHADSHLIILCMWMGETSSSDVFFFYWGYLNNNTHDKNSYPWATIELLDLISYGEKLKTIDGEYHRKMSARKNLETKKIADYFVYESELDICLLV